MVRTYMRVVRKLKFRNGFPIEFTVFSDRLSCRIRVPVEMLCYKRKETPRTLSLEYTHTKKMHLLFLWRLFNSINVYSDHTNIIRHFHWTCVNDRYYKRDNTESYNIYYPERRVQRNANVLNVIYFRVSFTAEKTFDFPIPIVRAHRLWLYAIDDKYFQ